MPDTLMRIQGWEEQGRQVPGFCAAFILRRRCNRGGKYGVW